MGPTGLLTPESAPSLGLESRLAFALGKRLRMHSHPQRARSKGLGVSTGHFSESVLTYATHVGKEEKISRPEKRGTSPPALLQSRTGPRATGHSLFPLLK